MYRYIFIAFTRNCWGLLKEERTIYHNTDHPTSGECGRIRRRRRSSSKLVIVAVPEGSNWGQVLNRSSLCNLVNILVKPFYTRSVHFKMGNRFLKEDRVGL